MPTEEKLGRIIAGRYRVRRILGAGAHGRVYLAEDLGRGGGHVALKLVEGIVGGAPQDSADDILRRFRHPRWAAVLDQGVRTENAWFQVVEYVRGQSLDTLEKPQPIELVWRLLEDGARVLGALHRLGLIHYDVTPGNVMLSNDGGEPHFVLTDGGLAHLGPVRGVARGTPQYMAPEVTEEGGHDHRADLYALGLVAFRLATGRDPFEGSAGDVLGKRRRDDSPRASTFRPDLPAALDDVIAALLARDPNARPHDALALLARLDGERPDGIAPFLHAEGVAAAEGGSLVGRSAIVDRFDASLGVIAKRIAAGGGRLARARAPVLSDPVLILRGAPGGGCTRVADECFDRARDANVPALLMSGRETTGDRRGPLRHLVDGMAALRLGAGDVYREIRLDLGTRKSLGREERAHDLTRAVEAFVRGVETTAKRTPFVLVVEDFPDLPQRAREAVRVLARHLLARRESGGATTAPPVLMLVDIGEEAPDSLLVPDTSEPERPIATLEPLTADEAAAVCAERFPGLEPVRTDLERILEVSEGLPGALVTLLAEGCRRGDLCYESGRWSWNVDTLGDYDIERGLSPVHADALRAASKDVRRLLAYLSLVEAPLQESVVAGLWAQHSEDPIPSSALIRTLARGDETHFTTTNLAIRKAVLLRLDEPLRSELAADLLAALDAEDRAESALDRAQLRFSRSDHRGAIKVMHDHATSLPSAHKSTVQRLLRAISERAPDSLHGEPTRTQAAHLLELTPEAKAAALVLADSLRQERIVDVGVAVAVCETLWATRDYRGALSLLDHVLTGTLEGAAAAEVHTLRAGLLFRLHQESDARVAIRNARRSFRQVPDRRNSLAEPLARMLMMEAQSQFLLGNIARASRALRAAGPLARRGGSPSLRASVVNTMGIVAHQAGDDATAQKHFRRALRLRRLLGDVNRIIGTTLNLGRLHLLGGSLVKGASVFQQASGIAQRFAHHGGLAMALRFLAQAYDQQLNPRLAAATYRRVIQLGDRTGNPVEAMQAAWDLAPLEAALGDEAGRRRALAVSANAARAGLTEHARASHHLVAAVSSLHVGNPEKATVSLGRALRMRSDLYIEHAQIVDILAAYFAPGSLPRPARSVRPARGERPRFLYRTAVWGALLERGGPGSQHAPDPQDWRASGSSPSGRDRRLAVEVMLRAACRTGGERGDEALARLERHLTHTGEQFIHARVLAARSRIGDKQSPVACAQYFSRSIAILDTLSQSDRPIGATLPEEHESARAHHEAELGLHMPAPPCGRAAAHALAHRLLVHHGCTTAPDGRVASALRRVLAATGRMNAGAGLDDLLEAMTRDTIEITGAERACVVLVDSNTQLEMRVATSATGHESDVDVEDLSQTVIQRVIESRTPLLMHDVFDDEELMGRPSITSLSLRSILCVPMLRGETLYGVLYADSASAAGSFDSVDQEVLSLFAEQAAAALETHRLVADVQNSMSELKAMQERLVKGERLRTMGELSSGVAHEFNNLLTSILARVQLINLNNLGGELKSDLDLIEKACLDAAEVVRRLQSYTRQQRQEHFERVDLADVCRDAVEFLRPLWSTRRRHGRTPIHVKLRVGDDLHVMGNPTELREVVTNLLKNALDALPDGGDIYIRAQHNEGLVQLQVEDDGPGIPEEIRSKIFDPFFTTKGERGTGLGLCLSQQIVDRHGGEMVLDSHAGCGTRFSIVLPTADGLVEANGQNEETLEGREPTLRILVVDDDENVRKPLCRFLERSGYEVVSAQDGEEGESVAREHHPDVVITDVAMPRVDGLELCRRLKRERAEVPIVLMSGWTSGVDPARARLAGATALLAKPFALQQVTELLGTIAEAARRDNDTRPRNVPR